MGLLIQYGDQDEKRTCFDLKEFITNKSELDDLIQTLQRPHPDSIWRGLAESKFKHYTSLQRFWNENNLPESEQEVEKYIRHVVKTSRSWNDRCLPKYFESYRIKSVSILSSLSILRHHGAPTPLIDWSRNPLVALYFAASDVASYHTEKPIENFFSLYKIDPEHPINQPYLRDVYLDLFNKYADRIKKARPEEAKDPNFLNDKTEELMNRDDQFYNFYKKIFKQSVLKIEDTAASKPKFYVNNNYNISNQEGLFLLNIDPTEPLEEAWKKIINNSLERRGFKGDYDKLYAKHKDHFICYDISKTLKQYALRELNELGINEHRVYPDIKALVRESVNSYFNCKETP